jgi:signal transduction histidine kinase
MSYKFYYEKCQGVASSGMPFAIHEPGKCGAWSAQMGTSPSGAAIHFEERAGSAIRPHKNPTEASLLIEAFETFTQASSSLESAFSELQARTRRLSQQLAAKNRELKKSLREKEEVQNYLARILESLPCGVLVLDESNNVTLCNPVAARILSGRKLKSADAGRRAVKRYLDAFSARESGTGETEIPYACLGKIRTLAVADTPLKNASGEPAGTLHIIRDITEFKALEVRNKRGERLAAMGEMAVELAHEIRNPLGSIELFASLLEKELPRPSDPGRWAENIRIGSRSLNNIVSNMLHFANPLMPQHEEVDLHEVIREILSFTEPILKQREVRVEISLESRSSFVFGDRELLKQMILNLALNSLQAMPARGSLILGTRDVAALPGGKAAGIELTVRDTGFGIPPENLSRIFDPFFTTNKSGTGLGLSVVHQIIDQHSGFVQVDSKVNSGTTFTITLPGARPAIGAA